MKKLLVTAIMLVIACGAAQAFSPKSISGDGVERHKDRLEAGETVRSGPYANVRAFEARYKRLQEKRVPHLKREHMKRIVIAKDCSNQRHPPLDVCCGESK